MKPENRPLAVCIDGSETSFPDPLLLQLLGLTSLPDCHHLDNDLFQAYDLRLDTKYYSADVWLARLREKRLCSQELSEAIEAVVLRHISVHGLGEVILYGCYRIEGPEALEQAECWLPFLEPWDAGVRILTSSRLQPQLKSAATQWCLKNGFELVELDPNEDEVASAEEWNELIGIARILQILKSHTWSNLLLKDGPNPASQRLHQLLDEDGEGEKETAATSRSEEDDLTALFGTVASKAAEEGEVSFEELFSSLASLKARGEGLSGKERKEHAERVTLAFWKAIGGDEEEIQDIGLDL